MSRFNIKNFARTPMDKLKKLNIGDSIELLTFKRDRKITLTKKDDHIYDVSEDGFEIKEFLNIEHSKLEKLLLKLQQIEFPRSHMFFLETNLIHT